MPIDENLQKDSQSALKDVESLRRELIEFSDLRQIMELARQPFPSTTAHLNEFQNRAAELLQRIFVLLNEISGNKLSASRESSAFALSTLANELQAQLDWLESILTDLSKLIATSSTNVNIAFLSQMKVPLSNGLTKIRGFLAPLLKKFLSKIWQIISSMLTPKEWKLTGRVGTGLLGLADVGIEITFGT